MVSRSVIIGNRKASVLQSEPASIMTGANHARHGAIAPLSLILMVVLIFSAAFSIEISRHLAVKSELQRSADAAALAGTWDLINERSLTDTRFTIREIGRANSVAAVNPDIELNHSNSPSGEIVFGRYNFQTKSFEATTNNPNAVRVRVHRSHERNGAIHSIFGSVLNSMMGGGTASHGFHGSALAAYAREIRGFTAPPPNQTLPVMPFVVRESEWNQLIAGNGSDEWIFDPATNQVVPGSDGMLELNIFPHITGLAGNSGTVNMGVNNNSTNELRRQILFGLSDQDIQNMGGKLELGSDGTLTLSGDPGISAGMQDALEEIVGETRVMPLYIDSGGQGNNAFFVINRFVGVRIMEVDFSGSKHTYKRLIVQPSDMRLEYTIPSTQPGTSEFIYPKNPVVLVQ